MIHSRTKKVPGTSPRSEKGRSTAETLIPFGDGGRVGGFGFLVWIGTNTIGLFPGYCILGVSGRHNSLPQSGLRSG